MELGSDRRSPLVPGGNVVPRGKLPAKAGFNASIPQPRVPSRPGAQKLPAPAQPADPEWQAAIDNPQRKLGFKLALVYVFLRFSFLHEILQSVFHANFYLILIVGSITMLVAILAGALQRTFRTRPAQYWLLFMLWMSVCIPFSVWLAGSVDLVWNYIHVTVPVIFIIGGLALTVEECFRVMRTLALASVVNILYGLAYSGDVGRLGMDSGSIANSNDFAAHLLMVLPFALFVAMTAKKKFARLGAFGLFVVGFFLGAKSGSRGALLAVCAGWLFLLFRLRGFARVALLAIVPVMAIGLVLFLPQSLKDRYATTFVEDGPGGANVNMQELGANEAVASAAARKYLLMTSIGFTLDNPLFGIGPGQFLIAEGRARLAMGLTGQWQVSHNSYTTVSSEEGFPGVIFFLAGIVSTFSLLNSVYKRCQAPELHAERLAAICIGFSMICFCSAIVFLSLSYTMYLPALMGLVIALERAVTHEIQNRERAAALPGSSPKAPGFSPGRPAFSPRLRASSPTLPGFSPPLRPAGR